MTSIKMLMSDKPYDVKIIYNEENIYNMQYFFNYKKGNKIKTLFFIIINKENLKRCIETLERSYNLIKTVNEDSIDYSDLDIVF